MRKYRAKQMQYRLHKIIEDMQINGTILVNIESNYNRSSFLVRICGGYDVAHYIAQLIAWLPMPSKVIDVEGMLNVTYK